VPVYKHEELSTDEIARDNRFWRRRAFQVPGLRQHATPAPWRDLSDVSTLEWFHHAMRLAGPVLAVSLNLNAATEAKIRTLPNAARWMRNRIARELKLAFGHPVSCWFSFDISGTRRLHLHGEIAITLGDAERARKALRRAGGEWKEVRQHQCHTRDKPTVVWVQYAATGSIYVRPITSERLARMIARPIAGDWFFATNDVRSTAKDLYTERRATVLSVYKSL